MANELTTWRPLCDLRKVEPGGWSFTLDPKHKDQQKLLVQACRGQPPSIKKAVNTVIVVSHLVYNTYDRYHKDTGEVKRLPRLVVIGPDGAMYSMSGWKAIEDVLFIHEALGIPLPFVPPHRFKVSMVPCGDNGQEYAALEWLGPVTK